MANYNAGDYGIANLAAAPKKEEWEEGEDKSSGRRRGSSKILDDEDESEDIEQQLRPPLDHNDKNKNKNNNKSKFNRGNMSIQITKNSNQLNEQLEDLQSPGDAQIRDYNIRNPPSPSSPLVLGKNRKEYESPSGEEKTLLSQQEEIDRDQAALYVQSSERGVRTPAGATTRHTFRRYLNRTFCDMQASRRAATHCLRRSKARCCRSCS